MNSVIKPVLRLPFRMGRILWTPDTGEGILPSIMFFGSNLRADVYRGEDLLDSRDLGSGVVTTAGVNYLAADFAGGASDINAFTYHATGIGTNSAVVGDTTLQNVTGAPARVSGTPSTPGSANIYQNVATVSYTGSLAITEWGLFSASTSGTLWDRRVFTAINVINGDSIQFTYQLTCTAGG